MMDRWAVTKLIEWAAGSRSNNTTKDVMSLELDELTAEFAGQNPTPIETVLARTAAIQWFALRLHEVQYGRCATAEGGMSIVQSDHQQRRIDRTHRRLMSTIKTLANVRRLAIPALQINVARQQVNQLSVGDPGGA